MGIEMKTSTRILLSGIPSLTYTCVMIFLHYSQSWRILNVPAMDLTFADLRQITSTAECAREIFGWSLVDTHCDPYSRPYNYPSLWAQIFKVFGVSESDTNHVGLALICSTGVVIWMISFLALHQKAVLTQIALITIVVISPPFLLASERGNSDLIVFCGVGVGLILLTSKSKWIGASILGFFAALKIYPITSYAMLQVSKTKAVEKIAFVLVFIATFVSTVPELESIYKGTAFNTETSYGVRIIPFLALGRSVPIDSLLVFVLGILFFALLTIFFIAQEQKSNNWLSAKKIAHELMNSSIANQSLVLTGIGILLFSYLIGTSWDYRLIFVFFIIVGFTSLIAVQRIKYSLVSATLIAMIYGTYPFRELEVYFDLIWLIFMPYLFVIYFFFTTEFLKQKTVMSRI